MIYVTKNITFSHNTCKSEYDSWGSRTLLINEVAQWRGQRHGFKPHIP